MRVAALTCLLLTANAEPLDAPLSLTWTKVIDTEGSHVTTEVTAFTFNLSSDFEDLHDLADRYLLSQPSFPPGGGCRGERACLTRLIAREAEILLRTARRKACCGPYGKAGSCDPAEHIVPFSEADSRLGRPGYSFDESMWGPFSASGGHT